MSSYATQRPANPTGSTPRRHIPPSLRPDLLGIAGASMMLGILVYWTALTVSAVLQLGLAALLVAALFGSRMSARIGSAVRGASRAPTRGPSA